MQAPEIVPVADRAGLEAYARILIDVTDGEAHTADELEYDDGTYPGAVRHLALVGDIPVGAVGVARIFVHPPEFDGLWCDLGVLATHRRRGIGTALLRTASARARQTSKTALHIPVSSVQTEAVAWLRRRGYDEHERGRALALRLADVATPAIDAPDGIAITSMADRPDLAGALYELAGEVLPDVPSRDAPIDRGTFAEFRRWLDDPRSPPDAYLLALAGEELVGYAHLELPGGRPGHGMHSMTGVRPDMRGRGIAQALKRTQIAWAKGAGLVELETENDETNLPMRAVNARLGYEPRPDWIIMRGPLA